MKLWNSEKEKSAYEVVATLLLIIGYVAFIWWVFP